jgi:hypothetical protein
MRIFLQTIFAFIFIKTATAQSINGTLQLFLEPPKIGQIVPADCWNLQIINAGQRVEIRLEGTILGENDREIVKIRSNRFFLNAGTSRFSRENMRTNQLEWLDAEAKKTTAATGSLPPGKYQICTTIRRDDDENELGSACGDANVADFTIKNKKNTPFRFYGNGQIEAFYADKPAFGQELPQKHIRVDLHPSAQVFQVPLTANLHWTSERGAYFPDMNALNLTFDRVGFQQNLQAMVQRKLLENFARTEKSIAPVRAKLTELDNLKTVLSDGNLQKELTETDQLLKQSNLENWEKNLTEISKKIELLEAETGGKNAAEITKLKSDKSKIEQKKVKLNQLLAKKRQIDKLRARAKELQDWRDQLQNNGQLAALQNARTPDLSRLDDPKYLRSELQKYGLFSRTNRTLYGLRGLTIGTCFPTFTPLLMQGIQVNGGSIDLNPGPIWLAAVGGRARSVVFNDSLPFGSIFEQNMVGGRVGFGKNYGSHVVASGIRFLEQKNSLALADSVTIFPRGNALGSIEGQLILGKKRAFELSGEVAGSLFNRNLTDKSQTILPSELDRIPNWLRPNLSTSADFAWRGRAVFNLFSGKTRAILNTRFVGPGYLNFGTPGLRRDILRHNLRLEQAIFGRKMRLAADVSLEADNLIGTKKVPTETRRLGFEWTVVGRKMPHIRLIINHLDQKNVFGDSKNELVNLTFSKPYSLGKMRATTTFSALSSFGKMPDSIGRFSTHFLTAYQVFALRLATFNLTFQGSQANSDFANLIQKNKTFSAGGGFSVRFFKTATAGIQALWNGSPAGGQRIGGSLNLVAPLGKNWRFTLAANHFSVQPTAILAPDFVENYLRAGILATW